MAKYFGAPYKHPPTMDETAAYYRARKIYASRSMRSARPGSGATPTRRCREGGENSDVLIPFASIDPAKGKAGAREARDVVCEFGIRGFKFHPTMRGILPERPRAYVLYEAIAEAGQPVLFHRPDGRGVGMLGGTA